MQIKNRFTGVEYIKYMQKASIDSNDFVSKISPCITSNSCDAYIDVTGSQDVTFVSYSPGLNLMYCSFGLITHKANPLNCSPQSEYVRSITVEPISATLDSNAYRVTSTVTYSTAVPPIVVSTIIHFDI
jgi:hypothetical protein